MVRAEHRTKEDLNLERVLWKRLSRDQDRLLAAYRLHKHPDGALLDRMADLRKQLEPYVAADTYTGKVGDGTTRDGGDG